MHDFVSFNGRIISAGDVQLPALAAATLYGKGVFTTVAVYGGIAEWWFEHWRRLSRDAPKVGVDISALDLAGTGQAIDELVRQNRRHRRTRARDVLRRKPDRALAV
jgi:branched-subunit amino acid aminotransferase/4-amino-4-deoxychorismate lyase